MEKIKYFFLKFKKWIFVLLAGIAIAFIAWKKHLESEISENKETPSKELEIKTNAVNKINEENAKIEEQKKIESVKIEEERKKKESEIKAEELKEKIRLAKLAKEDSESFKKEVTKKTGVVEKKKGRPKKQ